MSTEANSSPLGVEEGEPNISRLGMEEGVHNADTRKNIDVVEVSDEKEGAHLFQDAKVSSESESASSISDSDSESSDVENAETDLVIPKKSVVTYPHQRPVSPTLGFRVKYEKKEGAYGTGLYAAQYIPKGQLIWEFLPGENVLSYSEPASRALLKLMPREMGKDWLDHSFCFGGKLHYILDEGGLMNHSADNNCGFQPGEETRSGNCYALRDIQLGEEMFDNYDTFEFPIWAYELECEYDCYHGYFNVNVK